MASLAIARGDYDAALAMYKLMSPKRSTYKLALCHLKLSDFLDAIDMLTPLVDGSVDAKFLLAECYQQLGKHDKAYSLYMQLKK